VGKSGAERVPSADMFRMNVRVGLRKDGEGGGDTVGQYVTYLRTLRKPVVR
jgi:hypothetical protein